MLRRRFEVGVLLILLSLFYVGCASTKSVKVSAPEMDVQHENGEAEFDIAGEVGSSAGNSSGKEDGQSGSGSGFTVSIPIPERSRSYFFSIKTNVVELAQNGTPATMKQAAASLHRTLKDEYTPQERVLLNVMADVMRIVWPSESFTWDTPEVTGANPYTAAIDSARRGLYDKSTGNVDFFTTLLPALVVMTVPSKTEFYADARGSLEAALSLQEDSVLALYLLGRLNLLEKKGRESLDCINKVYAVLPSNRDVRFALAEALLLCARNGESLEMAQALVAEKPQSVEYLELAGRAAFASGQLELAEDYVLRVLQLEPESTEFVLLRTKIMIARGEFVKASALLDMYARTDTSAKDYLLLRANLQKNWNKNNNTAIETMTKALALYPNEIDVLLLSAQIASSAGVNVNGKSARELAEKVLAADPENIDAKVTLIAEMNKSGDYAGAYEMSSGLAKIEGVQSSVLHDHVDICLALGKKTEAWNLASKLYEENRNDETVQRTYMKTLVSTGRTSDAKALFDTLLPGAGSQMRSFLYYERSLIDSNSETMMADLRSSLSANPRNPDTLYRLYTIYYGEKDWRRAQYYLKQVGAIRPNDASVQAKLSELENLLK